jgi:hypothetical protein
MALIKEGNATPEFIFIPSKEEPSKESRFLEREILIYFVKPELISRSYVCNALVIL